MFGIATCLRPGAVLKRDPVCIAWCLIVEAIQIEMICVITLTQKEGRYSLQIRAAAWVGQPRHCRAVTYAQHPCLSAFYELRSLHIFPVPIMQ